MKRQGPPTADIDVSSAMMFAESGRADVTSPKPRFPVAGRDERTAALV